MHFRRRLDRLLDEGLHGLLRGAGDASQTNPSYALGFEHFRGYRHEQLARFSLTGFSLYDHERMLPITKLDIHLIDFDHPTQALTLPCTIARRGRCNIVQAV